MNSLNEEIRCIRTTIEAKKQYLKEHEGLHPIEQYQIIDTIKELQGELENRINKL